MRRTLAALGLLTMALLIFGLAWWRLSREVSVEAIHPDIPVAQWQDYMQGLSSSPPKAGGAMVALMHHWRALNQAEVAAYIARGRPKSGAAYTQALSGFREAVGRFLRERDEGALLQVGRWEGLRHIEALRELLRYAHRTGRTGRSLLTAKDPAVLTYLAVGGAFITYTEEAGLLDSGAIVEGRLPMVQALFVRRWIHLIHLNRSQDSLMTAEEREWLQRWRLELEPNIPLAEALAAAEALASVPGYPAQVNAGVALYKAGQYRQALQRFEISKARLAPIYARAARRALR